MFLRDDDNFQCVFTIVAGLVLIAVSIASIAIKHDDAQKYIRCVEVTKSAVECDTYSGD